MSRRERETQHRSPARHTQRSISLSNERRVLPAGRPPAALCSEVFVDEAPMGPVLLRWPRLDVKRKRDPGREEDQVERYQEVGEPERARDEAEVLDQQEQHD